MKQTIFHIIIFISLLLNCIYTLSANDNSKYQGDIDSALQNQKIYEDYDKGLKNLLDHWYTGYAVKASENHKKDREIIKSFSDSTIIKMLKDLPTALPVSFNPDIKYAIEMFAFKRRTLVSMMLSMGDIYFPEIEITLDRYQIPLELKYLTIVESGLNPTAKSRSGAGGLWQFMIPTARIYGLNINSLVDERFDFVKSTEAASRLLTTLYKTYGNWWLALAAYNSGPRHVNNAIKRAGNSNDFWEIYKYLPRETKRYIPTFVGVYFAMYYHKSLGIEPIKTEKIVATDYFQINKSIKVSDLSKKSGISVENIRFFNPQYIREEIPGNIGNGCMVRLPIEGIAKLDLLPKDSIVSNDLKIGVETTSFAYGKSDESLQNTRSNKHAIHTVKKGETLGSIAKKYRTTTNKIKRLNGLKSNKIRQGQKLRVK